MAEQPARAWRLVLEHIERDLLDARLGPGDRCPPSVIWPRARRRPIQVFGGVPRPRGDGPHPHRDRLRPAVGRHRHRHAHRGHVGAVAAAGRGSGLPSDDVVRTRLVLEDAVVQVLAAASDRDTSRAHELLEAMDARGLAPAEFLALDSQLHLSLAEASGNTVISAMMAGLRSSIESYVQAGVSAIPDWEAMATRLRSEHRALVAAIDAADVDAARALVHTHITGYYTSAGLTRDTHPQT